MTKKIIGQGKFLQLVNVNGWEHCERVSDIGVVVVIAVTAAREILLVEQYRPPINRHVIELPAGGGR